MRIGIVESESELSHLLKMGLQMAFYEKAKRRARIARPLEESLEIQTFTSLELAGQELAKAAGLWDVWFLNLQGQSAKGFEWIRRQREGFSAQVRQWIVVLDRGKSGDAQRGISAGADAILFKPFTLEEILPYIITGDNSAAP